MAHTATHLNAKSLWKRQRSIRYRFPSSHTSWDLSLCQYLPPWGQHGIKQVLQQLQTEITVVCRQSVLVSCQSKLQKCTFILPNQNFRSSYEIQHAAQMKYSMEQRDSLIPNGTLSLGIFRSFDTDFFQEEVGLMVPDILSQGHTVPESWHVPAAGDTPQHVSGLLRTPL